MRKILLFSLTPAILQDIFISMPSPDFGPELGRRHDNLVTSLHAINTSPMGVDTPEVRGQLALLSSGLRSAIHQIEGVPGFAVALKSTHLETLHAADGSTPPTPFSELQLERGRLLLERDRPTADLSSQLGPIKTYYNDGERRHYASIELPTIGSSRAEDWIEQLQESVRFDKKVRKKVKTSVKIPEHEQEKVPFREVIVVANDKGFIDIQIIDFCASEFNIKLRIKKTGARLHIPHVISVQTSIQEIIQRIDELRVDFWTQLPEIVLALLNEKKDPNYSQQS